LTAIDDLLPVIALVNIQRESSYGRFTHEQAGFPARGSFFALGERLERRPVFDRLAGQVDGPVPAVTQPDSVEEVARLFARCQTHTVPVLLSLKHLKKIRNIHPLSNNMVEETRVTLQ
jgi:hypothetical protein